MKLLLEMSFEDRLAGKLSKMGQQYFTMFPHIWIAFSTTQNSNTLATKIMCQEIVKLLLEVYFATILSGKLSKMCWQCFEMFPHIGIAFGTTQNGNTSAKKNNISRNCAIAAGSVFCRYACQNIIQNVLEVFPNVFPHLDCLQHQPKCRKIGKKSSKMDVV